MSRDSGGLVLIIAHSGRFKILDAGDVHRLCPPYLKSPRSKDDHTSRSLAADSIQTSSTASRSNRRCQCAFSRRSIGRTSSHHDACTANSLLSMRPAIPDEEKHRRHMRDVFNWFPKPSEIDEKVWERGGMTTAFEVMSSSLLSTKHSIDSPTLTARALNEDNIRLQYEAAYYRNVWHLFSSQLIPLLRFHKGNSVNSIISIYGSHFEQLAGLVRIQGVEDLSSSKTSLNPLAKQRAGYNNDPSGEVSPTDSDARSMGAKSSLQIHLIRENGRLRSEIATKRPAVAYMRDTVIPEVLRCARELGSVFRELRLLEERSMPALSDEEDPRWLYEGKRSRCCSQKEAVDTNLDWPSNWDQLAGWLATPQDSANEMMKRQIRTIQQQCDYYGGLIELVAERYVPHIQEQMASISSTLNTCELLRQDVDAPVPLPT